MQFFILYFNVYNTFSTSRANTIPQRLRINVAYGNVIKLKTIFFISQNFTICKENTIDSFYLKTKNIVVSNHHLCQILVFKDVRHYTVLLTYIASFFPFSFITCKQNLLKYIYISMCREFCLTMVNIKYCLKIETTLEKLW